MSLRELFQRKPSGFVVGDVQLAKRPENDDEIMLMAVEITKSLARKLPTEQDIYWFVIEQYDKMLGYNSRVKEIQQSFPISLNRLEYEGERSENSYVGKRNPGIVYLDTKVMPTLETHYGKEIAELIRASIFGTFCDGCKSEIERLRLKYAVHYHNNCVSAGSFNSADKWNDVISSIRGT
jgi:hypothetical protein